ncbi:MAG: GNAT family N-acetyltransferase [Bacteroidia bacterium]|jgi:RimJ/RimL family protein N-acetyltransferase
MQATDQIILETQRLVLRKLTLNDTAFILELLNSEGWIRFIGDRNVKNEEQAKYYLENGPLKSYREHDFGLWKVDLKENGIPIGMCGLLQRPNLSEPDIGFALLPSYTGKGYAFECAAAVLELAFQSFHLEKLSAIVVPHNTASISLLEKLGFVFIKQFSFPNEQELLCLYHWHRK